MPDLSGHPWHEQLGCNHIRRRRPRAAAAAEGRLPLQRRRRYQTGGDRDQQRSTAAAAAGGGGWREPRRRSWGCYYSAAGSLRSFGSQRQTTPSLRAPRQAAAAGPSIFADWHAWTRQPQPVAPSSTGRQSTCRPPHRRRVASSTAFRLTRGTATESAASARRGGLGVDSAKLSSAE